MDSIGGLVFITFCLTLYFLPAIMAARWHHHNQNAIFAFNLFFGWTLLGWLAAFIWALTKPAPTEPTLPARR